MQCCTASIDRSSQRHRVTGHWRRPFLCLFPTLLRTLSHPISLTSTHSPPHPLIVLFCDRLLSLSLSLSPHALTRCLTLTPSRLSLSLCLCLRDLSLSAYLVLNYPNSISVQLQFIPVSKWQSRRVHFASAPRRQKQSFLFSAHLSPTRPPSPVTPRPKGAGKRATIVRLILQGESLTTQTCIGRGLYSRVVCRDLVTCLHKFVPRQSESRPKVTRLYKCVTRQSRWFARALAFVFFSFL